MGLSMAAVGTWLGATTSAAAVGTMATGLAASTAATLYTSNQQAKGQQAAQNQATQNAAKTADLADQANNKANQKSPDSGALYSANAQAAKNGPSGTMLTGPSGVDPSALLLGKQTLLGG